MADWIVACPHCGRRNQVSAAASGQVVARRAGAAAAAALRAWVEQALAGPRRPATA